VGPSGWAIQERLIGFLSELFLSGFADRNRWWLLSGFADRNRRWLLSGFADRNRRWLLSRSKFGQTHGRCREVLSKIQTKIPEPLTHDLPEFLSTSRARAPTIWVLFKIFISKNRLK